MKVLRSRLVDEIRSRLRGYPVVALIGMRQSGKTTVARDIVESRTGPTHFFFDLEDDRQLARRREPVAALEPLRGLVVLDEIQQLPGVFRSLRVLADRPGTPCRFGGGRSPARGPGAVAVTGHTAPAPRGSPRCVRRPQGSAC